MVRQNTGQKSCADYRANKLSIYTLLRKAQIRWTGHVHLTPNNCIPKQLIYGELVHGRRPVGGQKKRFKPTSSLLNQATTSVLC